MPCQVFASAAKKKLTTGFIECTLSSAACRGAERQRQHSKGEVKTATALKSKTSDALVSKTAEAASQQLSTGVIQYLVSRI